MKYPGSGAIAGVLIVLFSIAGAPGQDVAVTSNGTVLSGGPPPTEARHALQDRIEQESAGRITLLDFKPITTKFADVELEGRTFCEVQFEARIGFTESCRWAIQFGGRPLTFKTLKPGEQSPGVSSMTGQVIEVSEKSEQFYLHGSVWFTPGTNGWRRAGFGKSGTPVATLGAQNDACIANLKRLGLAFRLWSADNGDHYPFNVSTNAGGTLEACARGNDGFDANGFRHFQVLSNELNTPTILVCPADSSKQPTTAFQFLQAAHVSYQVRSGPKIDEANPAEVLACCPIHGHVLHGDGSVESKQRKAN